MKEVLCARTPAILYCADLGRTLAFYRDDWGFALQRQVPGMVAFLTRESVTVQLWQRRPEQPAEVFACRVLVDSIAAWQFALGSAPGQVAAAYSERSWGREYALTDCDGNRLMLVQAASRLASRRARA
jgi:predicted enzyme related to lactoylglutathione lyase